jgi:hypothetical protein
LSAVLTWHLAPHLAETSRLWGCSMGRRERPGAAPAGGRALSSSTLAEAIADARGYHRQHTLARGWGRAGRADPRLLRPRGAATTALLGWLERPHWAAQLRFASETGAATAVLVPAAGCVGEVVLHAARAKPRSCCCCCCDVACAAAMLVAGRRGGGPAGGVTPFRV